LAKTHILLTDVDGVMTDGSVFMGEAGEFKQWSIQDGLGLLLLRQCGFKVGWISARPSPATVARAKDLKLDFLLQPRDGKVRAAEELLRKNRLTWSEVCYVGDDVLDLGLLKRAGVAIVPSNGVAEARALAHYITPSRGGHGAVREVSEMILKAHGMWDELIADCAAR
jgi:3-deoxy-D-manno-octulosonate 8-phosphate phosphatase (KDO 8-P phosphatase)